MHCIMGTTFIHWVLYVEDEASSSSSLSQRLSFRFTCVILSLCLSLWEELYIIYMPASLTVLFFSLQDVEIILWCVMYDYCATWNIIFLGSFTLSDTHMYLLLLQYVFDFICMWSIKFDKKCKSAVHFVCISNLALQHLDIMLISWNIFYLRAT